MCKAKPAVTVVLALRDQKHHCSRGVLGWQRFLHLLIDQMDSALLQDEENINGLHPLWNTSGERKRRKKEKNEM